MCSELFRIPYTWGGVPIFGFGVLLAIWALASATTVIALVRQHGWSAETWSGVPVLLLLGAAIVFLPRVFPDGLPIRGYGLMLLVGVSTGVGLAVHRARQGGIDPDVIFSLAIWMVVCGIIGARLFYVIEYWHESFAGRNLRDTLFEIANIPEGGLVIYGGLVGAAVGFVTLVRKQRLPILAMADLIAPSMAIGLAFGRVGCFLNGCCYGGQTDWPWHVTFPEYSSRYELAKSMDSQRLSPPYIDQASHGEMHGFRFDPSGHEPAVVTRVDPQFAGRVGWPCAGDSIAAINGLAINNTRDATAQLFGVFRSQEPVELALRSGKTIKIPAVAPPARSLPVHPTQLYSAIDGRYWAGSCGHTFLSGGATAS